MNATDPLDDLLDARLREEMPYIDDAGFTSRVLQQLPRHSASLRTERSLIIFVAAIVSAVVAYFASGEGMFIQKAVAHVAAFTPLQLLLLLVTCGILMTISGLWAALSRIRDPSA